MTGGQLPEISTQRAFWNEWNARHRVPDELPGDVKRRGFATLQALADLSLSSPDILEIGCATGWLCRELSALGSVTGIDLADDVIRQAEVLVPEARFVAGDFLTLDLGQAAYDVVVSLETIAHVEDKGRFLDRVAELLRPGGHLILTTQNRWVWQRASGLEKPDEIVQEFFDMNELKAVLRPRFEVLRATTLIPYGDLGLLRVVNARKLNRPLKRLFGARRINELKERLGLGNTLFVVARKR